MYITHKQYDKMTKKASPGSKTYINTPLAFLIGGLICALGQCIVNLFKYFDFDKESASSWASIILVLISALLTGLGLYEKIAKHAGAGTLVPITGFANAVVSPAIESKSEGFILGVGAKIFSIAGPVILYGISASFLYGLVYYFMNL
ncbi:MAG: stage V sporulation protein AC [Oscillospiraceae bacterium]|nr:stage V sporulation protein AC [Oscillospiraceae bacterium]